MPEPTQNILITGACGTIGTAVVSALAQRPSARVVAMDLRPPREAEQLAGVGYLAADITETDLEATLRAHSIDTVIHLAAILKPPAGAPEDLAYRVDVLGTERLLEACVATGVRRIIVTSSGAAYGYHPDSPRWLDESDALRGNEELEYARNKRRVEALLSDYRARHPELLQVVFRPGTVIGAGMSTPVLEIFEGPVMLGVWGSDSPFVFISVDDVTRCVVIATGATQSGVYNLAGDGALSPREIARRLHKPFVPIPAVVLRGALWALHGLGLSPYGPEHVSFLRYRPVLSNRRLKEEFGYVPRLSSSAAFDAYVAGRS